MNKEEYKKLLEEVKEFKTSKPIKVDDELSCVHTIVFNNNLSYRWNERNIFDFGTVFNPDFSIMGNKKYGGVVKVKDNKYYFETYGKKNPDDKHNTWYIVRELTDYELKSYLIAQYDSEFGDMFRM